MEKIWIDVIFFGIILLAGVIGLFKGFFATALSLLGFLGTFVLAYFFSGIMVSILDSLFGLTPWLAGLVGQSIANVIAVIVAIIITYLVLRVLVFVLNHTIGKLFKGKVLGKLNSVLGFFLGLVKGAVFLGVFFAVANIASLIPAVNTFIEGQLTGTEVTIYVYEFVGDQIGNYLTSEEPAP
ncbi:MAG: CvpA family protein [Clostridia bacterium]|nr:CvpA family protein [Clostridia bacterium]